MALNLWDSPRQDLARACEMLNTDASGSSLQLAERLDERVRAMTEEFGHNDTDARLRALDPRDLRLMCGALELDPWGTKAELLERLRAFRSEVASREGGGGGHTRRTLDRMELDELRAICEDMGLDLRGKKAALVARILMAQEEASGERGGEE